MIGRIFVVALICLSPSLLRAESTGEIDWQHRTIKAHGQGAPDLNAPSVSAARLGAEKAAKADAFRNLLETLKGVSLASGDKLGTLLQSDNGLRAQVEGTLRGFRIVSPHYYSDGGVALDVEVDLDKLPAALIAKLPSAPAGVADAAPGPASLPAASEEKSRSPAQAKQPPAIVERGAKIVVQARGQGVPDLNAASIAVARIGAERAARLDALKVLLAALSSGDAEVGKMLEADPALRTKVDGALRGYFVSKVHYYSDGGVALDVELPIDQLPPELRAHLHPRAN